MHFAEFMSEVSRLLEAIDSAGSRWIFVRTALDFLWMGFSCEGSEQLLWNVTTIEAVLGEKKDGLTTLLRRRLSAILGTNPPMAKEIKKQFDEIYKARSDYVHGNAELPQANVAALLLASGEFARRVLIWILRCLGHVCARLPGQEPPTREALLQVLDMDCDRRKEVSGLLSNLPDSYPAVGEWLD